MNAATTVHSSTAKSFADYVAQPGDIFACWGTDIASRAISLETSLLSWLTGPKRLRWSPSHVAMAAPERGYRGLTEQLRWFESTTMTRTPCLLAGVPVAGVQCHPIRSRIIDYVRGQGGRVDVYRLHPIKRLKSVEAWLLSDLLTSQCGDGDRPPVSYDTEGAVMSGTRLLKRLPFSFSVADLNQLFCSELLSVVLQRLGRMNHANPAKYHPGLLVRELVRQGTYVFHKSFQLVEQETPRRWPSWPLCSHLKVSIA